MTIICKAYMYVFRPFVLYSSVLKYQNRSSFFYPLNTKFLIGTILNKCCQKYFSCKIVTKDFSSSILLMVLQNYQSFCLYIAKINFISLSGHARAPFRNYSHFSLYCKINCRAIIIYNKSTSANNLFARKANVNCKVVHKKLAHLHARPK